MVRDRRLRLALITALPLVTSGVPGQAAGTAPIAGNYRCASGCLQTDAPPAIEIDGDAARCMNTFGGVYAGRLLTNRSVSCFNQTGILSDDGTSVLWSNGAVWKRR